MRVLVIEHDHVSPIGPVGECFSDRGYDVSTHLVVPPERFSSPGVEAHFPDVLDFDVVVPMGAPWSTYAVDTIGSWVLPELDLLRQADAAGIAVLGLCFGGQMIATAHGGSVRKAEAPEVGWYEISSDEPEIVPSGPWFQWHSDTWALPPGARELARTPLASQAFVLRRNLAVQFHPELTGDMLAGWLGNGGAAQAEGLGLDPEAMLAQTRAVEERSRARAHALVDGFLAHVVP